VRHCRVVSMIFHFESSKKSASLGRDESFRKGNFSTMTARYQHRGIPRCECERITRPKGRHGEGAARRRRRRRRGGSESRRETPLVRWRLFDVGCLLYGRGMIVTAPGCTEGRHDVINEMVPSLVPGDPRLRYVQLEPPPSSLLPPPLSASTSSHDPQTPAIPRPCQPLAVRQGRIATRPVPRNSAFALLRFFVASRRWIYVIARVHNANAREEIKTRLRSERTAIQRGWKMEQTPRRDSIKDETRTKQGRGLWARATSTDKA